MKSLNIINFRALNINLTQIFLLKELHFINLFCLGPKGCKLMKINTSLPRRQAGFRIRGEKRNLFLHPLANKKFLSDNSEII